MKRIRAVALVAVLGLVLAACGGTGGTTTTTTAPATTTTAAQTTTTADPRADWPSQLVFGFVPSREAEGLQDRVDVLAGILADALDIDVIGLVTPDYPALGIAMGNNSVQIGALPPLGYVTAARAFPEIELFAQSERNGSLFYWTQYFTNDPGVCTGEPEQGSFMHNEAGEVIPVAPGESTATQVGWNSDGTREEGVDPGLRCPEPVSLAGVAGNTFAFVSQGSASGYLFPLGELLAAGVNPGGFTPMFGGSHDGAITAVLNNDAKFGASFDDARRNIRETVPDVGSRVIVFNISKPIPNDVIAIRTDLPESLKDAIYDALAAFIATDEGLALMDEIYSWTGLVRAGPLTEQGMEIIRQAAEEAGLFD